MSDENQEPETSKEHPCDNGTCDCDCSEAREGREETPLTLASMGLAAFRSGDGLSCPKCHSSGLQKRYHEMVIMSMGDEMHPCQEWVQKGLLQGQVGEHLCLRCQGCGYGFPMKTADT